MILSFTVCDQITMGISTLLGPRSQHLAAFTDTMCSHLHIPHIEYRETTLAQTLLSGFSINIHPKSDQLARAYIDLIDSYKMKSVLLIYEHQGGKLYFLGIHVYPQKLFKDKLINFSFMSYYFFKDIVQTEFIERFLTVCKKTIVSDKYTIF